MSNISWAGVGMFDNMPDNAGHTALHDSGLSYGLSYGLNSGLNSDVMHHLVDEHHDDHDCHMAAHLIGLNSNTISIAHFAASQVYSPLDIKFSSHNIAPPNRPPRN